MRTRYNIENILAHNGTEVVSVRSTEYVHSTGAKIIADWRENGIEYQPPSKAKRILSALLEKAEDKAIEILCFILFEPETEEENLCQR